MEDFEIVSMFWNRDENAVLQARAKYNSFCRSVAVNILSNNEDVEEVLNDTFLGAWNCIPPNKPQKLSTFLGKITRNIALKKYRQINADKRGGGVVAVSLDELSEFVSKSSTIEEEISAKELAQVMDSFLRKLPIDERRIFIRRYWYFDSIEKISIQFGYSQSKTKMTLLRTREKLKKYLEREGVII